MKHDSSDEKFLPLQTPKPIPVSFLPSQRRASGSAGYIFMIDKDYLNERLKDRIIRFSTPTVNNDICCWRPAQSAGNHDSTRSQDLVHPASGLVFQEVWLGFDRAHGLHRHKLRYRKGCASSIILSSHCFQVFRSLLAALFTTLAYRGSSTIFAAFLSIKSAISRPVRIQ